MSSTKTQTRSGPIRTGREQVEEPMPLVSRSAAVPQRAQRTQWRTVGRDTLVLHLGLKQYHVLNHIAGRIWDLCDGARAEGDIAAILADEFGIDEDVVIADVADTVDGFERLGLIARNAVSDTDAATAGEGAP